MRGRNGLVAGGVAALAALGVLLAVLLGGGSSDPYRVRAIFDDAVNLTAGEQVEIAGVPVGSVESVEPTFEGGGIARAAVVMSITRPGFEDFRADASCMIRPQSLLGENYVDCQPTGQHAEGTPLPPPLRLVPSGQEGAGERLLPVQNTESPVTPDLIQGINQLPERERLRIIINELGTGLEGRGADLHEVIIRANPALREANKVLHILASENTVLSRLAVNSDRALAPLSEVRHRVAGYLAHSNVVASASARHDHALARNLADFPPFLEQLGPAMERLARFGEETAPVMRELGVAAPAVNRLFAAIPGFSRGSTAYFKSVGGLSETAGADLKASEPLLARLEALGKEAEPFSGNLSSLLERLRSTGGIERLMDFIYLYGGASNGYDSLGHFLRVDLVSLNCTSYVSVRRSGCGSNFIGEPQAAKAQASAVAPPEGPPTLTLPHGPPATGGSAGGGQSAVGAAAPESGSSAGAAAIGSGGARSTAGAAGSGRGPAGGTASAGGAQKGRAAKLLLNYLLGE